MTICNVCTLNLRQANWQLKNDDSLRARVNENLERVGVPPYSGGIEVKHFLWLIAEGEGFELLKQVAHKGLKGLKVAPFYGCQILRPSKILGFEDPDRPWSLERIITACGGEPVDYPAKIKCCGFPIIQAREETALGELIQPIEQAMEAGADAMVTPCPLCHLSLDAWQQKLEASTGRTFGLPIIHLSQLVGVAAGLTESELKFKRHVVPVDPVVEKLQRLTREALRTGAAAVAGVATAGIAWGLYEAAWVRLGELPVGRSPACRRSSRVCGSPTSPTSTSACPPRRRVAIDRAVEWVAGRQPDLVLAHRRPARPARGSGAAARADRPPAAGLRRARQPRLRRQPRPVLEAGRRGRSRARHAALATRR